MVAPFSVWLRCDQVPHAGGDPLKKPVNDTAHIAGDQLVIGIHSGGSQADQCGDQDAVHAVNHHPRRLVDEQRLDVTENFPSLLLFRIAGFVLLEIGVHPLRPPGGKQIRQQPAQNLNRQV